MKNVLLAIFLFGFGVLASEVSHHFMGGPTIIANRDAALTMGKSGYPSDYGFSDSVYLVMDKETGKDDASIVFREAGSARVEIGLVEDNDFHIKTVTGNYGREIFVDRFLVRSTGEVDGLGKIMRQYATSGVPIFAVGDTDGSSTGSGVEISYDHAAGVGNIVSISRGVSYRQLNFSGSSFSFFAGESEIGSDPVVSITPTGFSTSGIAGVGTYTVATLPTPVGGGMILVSDGAAGNPVLSFSEGTQWLRSDTLEGVSPADELAISSAEEKS